MVIHMSEIYLNLGCYDKPFPKPFINVDIRPSEFVDVVDDARTLSKFSDESVNLIYFSHGLEHIPFSQIQSTLKRWYEVLKPGGILRVAVPDMDSVFAHYFYWKDLKFLRSCLMGSQRGDGYSDYHFSCWDFQTLKEELESAGFVDIKRWEPSEIWPHTYLSDYSQIYYPHFEGKYKLARGGVIDLGGKNLSLNLECSK